MPPPARLSSDQVVMGPCHRLAQLDTNFRNAAGQADPPLDNGQSSRPISSASAPRVLLENSIGIFIKMRAGTIPMNISASDCILDIKREIARLQHALPQRQRLTFRGKQLKDEQLLKDCNIRAGSTVSLLLRARGGMKLVSGGFDNVIKIWDADTGTCLHTLRGHDRGVRSVAAFREVMICPHAKVRVRQNFLSGSQDQDHSQPGPLAAASRVRQDFVTGSQEFERSIDLMDMDHTNWISEQDQLQLEAGQLGVVQQVLKGGALVDFPAHISPQWVQDTDFDKLDVLSDAKVVTASFDMSLKVWEVAAGTCIRTLEGFDEETGEGSPEGHRDAVWCVAVFPRGDKMLSGSRDKILKIWDTTSGKHLRDLRGHTAEVHCVAVFPAGRRVVSGSDDKTLRIWFVEEESKQVDKVLYGHSDSVVAVAVFPDGTQVASGSFDKTIMIWDAASGRSVHAFRGHSDFVRGVAVFSCGDRVVSASKDWTLKIWNMSTRLCIRDLRGHQGHVYTVAVLGDIVVSGSEDKTVKVWSATMGQCLRTLTGHQSMVNCVAISPVHDAQVALRLLGPSGELWCTLPLGELQAMDCVADLKERLQVEINIPPASQRLYHGMEELEDSGTVQRLIEVVREVGAVEILLLQEDQGNIFAEIEASAQQGSSGRCEEVVDQAKVVAHLVQATAGGNVHALSKAIAEASRHKIQGPEFDFACKALHQGAKLFMEKAARDLLEDKKRWFNWAAVDDAKKRLAASRVLLLQARNAQQEIDSDLSGLHGQTQGAVITEEMQVEYRIRDVYSRKNPAKLEQIDSLLEEHTGSDGKIGFYKRVCEKYGEQPVQFPSERMERRASELIRDLYKRRNPAQLGEAERLLREHPGSSRVKFYHRICDKYGETPADLVNPEQYLQQSSEGGSDSDLMGLIATGSDDAGLIHDRMFAPPADGGRKGYKSAETAFNTGLDVSGTTLGYLPTGTTIVGCVDQGLDQGITMFQLIDRDENSFISREEWSLSFNAMATEGAISRKMFAAAGGTPELFDFLKHEGEGKRGPTISKLEWMRAFDALDFNQDGTVDHREFLLCQVHGLSRLMDGLRVSDGSLKAAVGFLTDVGVASADDLHALDAGLKEQFADMLGLSSVLKKRLLAKLAASVS